MTEQIEKLKASVRAKVEHPFRIVKNIFGMKKVRYKGLAKNTAQLFTLFGLANLLIVKRWLFAFNAQGAPTEMGGMRKFAETGGGNQPNTRPERAVLARDGSNFE